MRVTDLVAEPLGASWSIPASLLEGYADLVGSIFQLSPAIFRHSEIIIWNGNGKADGAEE